MRLFHKILFAAVCTIAPLTAKATLIQFEDGTSGVTVNNYYQNLGVTFTNAVWTSSLGLPGTSGALGIINTSGYQWFSSNPIIASFSSGVSLVSVDGIDVGLNGLRINAYDAVTGGNLVSFQEVFGSSVGIGEFFQVKATGNNIKRVEIFQVQNVAGDGILLDNFKFETASVNTPASIALFTLGMAGLLAARRRKQNNC
jgi:hypothetical protein